MVSLNQLVPEDHLVRKIEQAIDFHFIYDLVEDPYCLDNGKPSIYSVRGVGSDPLLLDSLLR
jgi:hypothetical protein